MEEPKNKWKGKKEWLMKLLFYPYCWICLFLIMVISGIVITISEITFAAIIRLFLMACVGFASGAIANKVYKSGKKVLWFSATGSALLFCVAIGVYDGLSGEYHGYITYAIILGSVFGLAFFNKHVK